MGAEVFYHKVKAKSAEKAFSNAIDEAHWHHGHAGYTGTIAEKGSFVMIPLPKDKDPYEYANELIDADDSRINDKWGAAGCFKLANGEFFFFGWASC